MHTYYAVIVLNTSQIHRYKEIGYAHGRLSSTIRKGKEYHSCNDKWDNLFGSGQKLI